MPLAFPSHQGLVKPLLGWWPSRILQLPLWVGAAIPDVVDGVLGAVRGQLGQSLGHSLVGALLLGVPLGLVLTWLLGQLGQRLSTRAEPRSRRQRWLGWLALLDPPRGRWGWQALSVSIGALSHLVFDLISHGTFPWLLPWYDNPRIFPAWWYVRWLEVPLPGYAEPYAVGPHLLVWLLLSGVGILLFFRPHKRP